MSEKEYVRALPQPRMVMTRNHDVEINEERILALNKMAAMGYTMQQIANKTIQSTLEESLEKWITEDEKMRKIKEKIRQIYARDMESPVLIIGPTGTGKEMLARAFQIRNREGDAYPFVAVNCGGIPETLIESIFFGHKRGSFTGASTDQPGLLVKAGEGVIFLDEVGELPLNTQAKLLRAIQELEIYPVGEAEAVRIKCRFVAATHRNLYDMVEHGKFREDLYIRISTHELEITGLKERQDDIKLIAQSLDWQEEVPEHVLPDIFKYNVRGIQRYIKRMRTYGQY